MPSGYHHLTHEERCQIYALRKSGLSDPAITGPTSAPELRARCGNGRCCTSEWKWGNDSPSYPIAREAISGLATYNALSNEIGETLLFGAGTRMIACSASLRSTYNALSNEIGETLLFGAGTRMIACSASLRSKLLLNTVVQRSAKEYGTCRSSSIFVGFAWTLSTP